MCDDHLGQGIKLPFMLGNFGLHSVISILESKFSPRWTEIRDLTDCDGRPYRVRPESDGEEHKRHGHHSMVVNRRFNVWLNHDFITEGDEILNYSFVQKITEQKVQNLTRALNRTGGEWSRLREIVFLHVSYLKTQDVNERAAETVTEYVDLAKKLRAAALNLQTADRVDGGDVPAILVICLLLPRDNIDVSQADTTVVDGNVTVALGTELNYHLLWRAPGEERVRSRARLVHEFERRLDDLHKSQVTV
jgi:hypothetical protein